MPTITVGQVRDMSELDRDTFLDVLEQGEVTGSMAGWITYAAYPDNPNSERYTFSGSGFGAPGANGFPTTGTITGLLIESSDGLLLYQFTAVSIPVSAFNAALAAADPQVFIDLLFGDGATIQAAAYSGIGEILEGHGGDDIINGYDGQDLITGGDGNDELNGGDETGPTAPTYGDAIDGGAGDDVISGGAGRDLLLGGEGADTIDGGADADVIYDGGAGFASTQAVTFIVPSLQDVRLNSAVDGTVVDQSIDTLNGGEGNDTIFAGLGDILDGGLGTDQAVINFGHAQAALQLDLSVAADIGAAIAAASGGSYVNIESFAVRGTDFGDTVIGSIDNNIFYGGAGADLLEGRDGVDQLIGSVLALNQIVNGQMGGASDDGVADTLVGGEGNDQIHVGALDNADGGNGTDTLYITLAALSGGVNLDLTTGDRFATLAAASGGTLTGFENISYVVTSHHDDVLRVAHSGNYYMLDGDDLFEGDNLVQFVGGNAGNDVIRAFGGNDRLWGGDGDDQLEGGDGDDFIYADEDNVGSQRFFFAGNDIIDGGAGNDQVAAGGGDDLMLGGAGADRYDGGEGFDTVDYSSSAAAVSVSLSGVFDESGGDAAADVLMSIEGVIGSAFDDVLFNSGGSAVRFDGGAGNDGLTGGALDDVLVGGAGVDTLSGGDGVDTADYSGAAGAVTARLDTGASSNDGDGGTDSFSSIENLTGSAFDDLLFGNGAGNALSGGLGRDTLLGLGGNDVLRGGTGLANQLYGGLGDDLYVVEASGDTIVENAGEGTDTVETTVAKLALSANVENLTYTGAGTFTGSGNALANVITGGAARDVLLGLGGDDLLIGGAGAPNQLFGGVGDDRYVVSAADSIIENLGEGVDTVETSVLTAYTLAANVENLIYGGTGAFTGSGNAGNNTLTGGAGDDVLRGRGGVDVLQGGLGMDTADYSLAAAGIHARLDNMRAVNDGDGGTDTYVGIEAITGSAFNDLLVGGGLGDRLSGGFGADTLLGFAGNDILAGGQGAANQLQGGLGDDLYVLDAYDTVVELAGQGIDTIEAHVGAHNMGANVENMYYVGNNKFYGAGNALNNVITGGVGDDILKGMGGNDTLIGGAGTDEVQFRGSQAQYTVTAEGAGYRIVDSVGGRDGSTFVDSIETLRFMSGNTTTILTYGAPAPLESEAKATFSEAQVLPSFFDDDAFVLPALPDDDQPTVLPGLADFKFDGEPLILPGVEADTLPVFSREDYPARTSQWMLNEGPDGEPVHRADDWLG